MISTYLYKKLKLCRCQQYTWRCFKKQYTWRVNIKKLFHMIFVFVKMQNAVPKLKSPIIKKKLKLKLKSPNHTVLQKKRNHNRREENISALASKPQSSSSHQNTVSSTCTIPQPLYLFIHFQFLYPLYSFNTENNKNSKEKSSSLLFLSLSSPFLDLQFISVCDFKQSQNGSNRADNRSERAGRSGSRQIGDGPKAHGRSIPSMSKL